MFWYILLLVLVLSFIVYYQYVRLSFGRCKSSRHLLGKVAIVTGANTGCGFETAKEFADRGAKVILACRSEERGHKARDEIIASTGNKCVYFYKLDLSSFKSVREFVDRFKTNETRLDILVNNAGDLELDVCKTEDGLLLGMQVNYFGPFLLTNLLLPLLKTSAPSRIVNVASKGYKLGKVNFDDFNFGIDSSIGKFKVYANAKLCTVLSTIELAKKLQGTGVTVNSLCPGFVNTNIISKIKNPIFRLLLKLNVIFFSKNAWEGAQTQIYLSVSPEVSNVSGHYFNDCKREKLEDFACNPNDAEKLWDVTEEMVRLKEM